MIDVFISLLFYKIMPSHIHISPDLYQKVFNNRTKIDDDNH